jgi:hypothetical protein
MLIFMAANASGRDSQKRFAEILHLDRRPFTFRDMLRRVTALAVDVRVRAFEFVARLDMIEGLKVPFRQDKILTVVFGVAVHTLHTRTWLDVVGGVQPSSRNDARSNFLVTAETLEYWFAGRDFVASNTVSHAIDRMVRA